MAKYVRDCDLQRRRGKNALVSYITAPVRLGPHYQQHMFSNAGIARSIVKVLVQMGYTVDLIDWTCQDFESDKDYDLFLGHAGANWEYLSRNVVGDAVKIYFSTSLYWKQFNRREAERFDRFERQHGVRLPYDRWIEFSEEFACHDADGIICLGNAVAAESYGHFPLAFVLNNGVYRDNTYDPSKKDFEAGRRQFLYFGSSGSIHKGLDLLLEAFMGLDAELWCAGRMEPAFLEVYRQDLTRSANIHLVGWVDLRSPLFYELMNRCNCTILASCAEGSPGSVVECMNQGLIPIITQGTTIDVDGFGVMLEEDSVEEVARVVREVMNRPARWHYEHSIKARQAAVRDFSEEAFCQNLRLGIEQIIRRAPQVRAERQRIASEVVGDLDSYLARWRNDLGALLRAAALLKSRGQIDQAHLLWQQALAVEPSCLTAMCELARCYLDNKRCRQALGIARRALKQCPRDRGCLAILEQGGRLPDRDMSSEALVG